ncbi:MAG: hypothetical protein EZS28_020328 [Streblomastix strix]|uniref:Uncharacterized protein n=1 Tax=Streblomastix strix TaxID=222440 RepID=A0A5J4VNV3_9EUKA|nr:MAG: hypothetical protein EZS28_020328 [Streblomastix strix]
MQILSLVYILILLVKADSQVDCSIEAGRFYTVSSKRSCLNFSRQDIPFKQFRNSTAFLLPFSAQIQCLNYAQLICNAEATKGIYDVPLSEFNEIDISRLLIARIYMPGQKLLNEEKPASTVLINWAKDRLYDQNASLGTVNTVLQQEFWYDTASSTMLENDTMKVNIQGDGNKTLNYYMISDMSFVDVSYISEHDSSKKEDSSKTPFFATVGGSVVSVIIIIVIVGCCCYTGCCSCGGSSSSQVVPVTEDQSTERERERRQREKEEEEREQERERRNKEYEEKLRYQQEIQEMRGRDNERIKREQEEKEQEREERRKREENSYY